MKNIMYFLCLSKKKSNFIITTFIITPRIMKIEYIIRTHYS